MECATSPKIPKRDHSTQKGIQGATPAAAREAKEPSGGGAVLQVGDAALPETTTAASVVDLLTLSEGKTLLAKIQDEVDALGIPDGWTVRFNGFGGTTESFQTKVYTASGGEEGIRHGEAPFHFEIRVPLDPNAFPLEAVEWEYGCRSAATLQEAVMDLAEALDAAD